MTPDEFNLRIVLGLYGPGRLLHVELQCPGRALQAGIVALASIGGLLAAILSNL
jgi:hypothetical protein